MIPIKNDKQQLAEEHYNLLNNHLVKTINRIIRKNGISKRDGTNIGLSQKLHDYLESLLQHNNDKLKKLITSSPKELILIVRYLNTIILYEEDLNILSNIFVNHGYDRINKFKFTKSIDIQTCPYCNRNYIFSIKKNREIKPEIDHFYPKSVYPLLGVCFYNLIPTCQSCNGLGGKKETDPYYVDLISPYLLMNDDFEFTFNLKSIDVVNNLSNKSNIGLKFKKSIKSHCDTFNLDDLYSLHHDHVIELIIKKRVKYSIKYRKYLNSYENLKLSDSEIDRMILGNYSLEDEQHKRPLSKLYQDIGKELGLI